MEAPGCRTLSASDDRRRKSKFGLKRTGAKLSTDEATTLTGKDFACPLGGDQPSLIYVAQRPCTGGKSADSVSPWYRWNVQWKSSQIRDFKWWIKCPTKLDATKNQNLWSLNWKTWKLTGSPPRQHCNANPTNSFESENEAETNDTTNKNPWEVGKEGEKWT